jgi:enoyl-CoA hydratase/carnithine racemase
MGSSRITVDGIEGAARLTLARPAKRNALDRRSLEELAEAVVQVGRSSRVIVLRGEGSSFCSGIDLEESGDPDSLTTESIAETVVLGRRAADALQDSAAITIAAVHGHCLGGGVVLAASCDLRLASTDARFRMPEVDLGIPLAWGGIPRLLRTMPTAVAKELVMTGRVFDAAEASDIGFVNRVVEGDRLGREVDALVDILIAKPAAALAVTKAQFAAMELQRAPVDDVRAVLAAIAGDPSAITGMGSGPGGGE